MKQFIPIIILCIVIIIIALASSLLSRPGAPPKIQPLSIGDQLPEIKAVASMGENHTPLTWPKDKLLILEFISTHCSTCVRSIDQLQALQAQFANELEIILVTAQPQAEVADAFHEHGWTLPVVAGDTVLHEVFPHHTVPHQVWVQAGEVRAITHYQYATAANVQHVLAAHHLQAPVKADRPVDLTQPLLARDSAEVQPLYQSAITGPLPNGSGGYRRTDHSWLVYNASVASLYNRAFHRPEYPVGAYRVLEMSDSLKALVEGPAGEITGDFTHDKALYHWREHATFCYNIAFPAGSKVTIRQFQEQMQQDLNHYFGSQWGISGRLEAREVTVLALVALGDSLPCVTRGGKGRVDVGADHLILENKSINLLTASIGYRHHYLGMPVVNATGYQGHVDLHLTCGLQDLEQVNTALRAFGLGLMEKEMTMEMLVIADQAHYTNQNQTIKP
ncbi:redoxin family protein [Marinoscillum luteum]|uniref:Redoxin family protein n=1 Tax=Marinoscillum luteum TaxID=861051 RepID=A0ABW7N7A1_9BACT